MGFTPGGSDRNSRGVNSLLPATRYGIGSRSLSSSNPFRAMLICRDTRCSLMLAAEGTPSAGN